jgi:hypothetical protein
MYTDISYLSLYIYLYIHTLYLYSKEEDFNEMSLSEKFEYCSMAFADLFEMPANPVVNFKHAIWDGEFLTWKVCIYVYVYVYVYIYMYVVHVLNPSFFTARNKPTSSR